MAVAHAELDDPDDAHRPCRKALSYGIARRSLSAQLKPASRRSSPLPLDRAQDRSDTHGRKVDGCSFDKIRPSRSELGSQVAGRPPAMPCREQREHVISVTEKDLRRCGNNLKLLRECHEKMRLQREKEPKCETLQLSFKSAFAQLCHSHVDAHDPWKGRENPEMTREFGEADYILNQVWTDAFTRNKKEAGAKDEALPSLARGCSSSASTRAAVRRPNSTNRCSSREFGQRHSSADKAPSCREDSAVASGSVVDRIRLRSLSPDTGEEACTGTFQVREATRMQQAFTQKLDENRLASSVPGVAWLFVTPLTGEVSSYPKAVVTRIEAAHKLGRTSVPLVGTCGDFEGAIIQFSDGSDRGTPIQKTWDGDIRDVCRIEVQKGDTEIVVHVVHVGDSYHLSDVAVPGKSEERRLPTSRIELARPQSAKLPPVNPHREPVYFLNLGADWPA